MLHRMPQTTLLRLKDTNNNYSSIFIRPSEPSDRNDEHLSGSYKMRARDLILADRTPERRRANDVGTREEDRRNVEKRCSSLALYKRCCSSDPSVDLRRMSANNNEK